MGTSRAAFGVFFIHQYQKFISPRKGYCCAHRAVHGGESCSSFGARVLSENGYRQGIAMIKQRLRACSIVFDEETKKKQKRDSSIHFGNCDQLKYDCKQALPEIGQDIACCAVGKLFEM